MFHRKPGQISPKSHSAQQKLQQTSNTTAPQVKAAHPATLIQRAKAEPSSLSAKEVLALQSAIGNREVSRLLAGRSTTKVQAKLTIGQPGDKYEQEADRVAAQVVEQIHAPASAQSTQGQSVQRQEESDEEIQAKPSISDLQRSPLSPAVQREAMPPDEELQAKSILQRREAIAVGDTSTDLDTTINSARGSGQPLDAGLQCSMGQAMGADFSGVRVHTDAQSDQLNQSIQAKAFTTGQDVFFRQGTYEPGSREGQELIAHELTHVVQQSGGVQRSPLTKVQSVDAVTETQRVNQLQPIISGKIIQRTWDTSGEEPVYRDEEHQVNWHYSSDGELWYETNHESSPYTGYAGIKNKGSYAKWFMLTDAPFEPFELLKEQTRTIQIPEKDKLKPDLHSYYQLYVYLIRISTLKWNDIVKKQPFSKLSWVDKQKVYNHYEKYTNPLVVKEDEGLNYYYGPGYQIINPFLRAIRDKFSEERYDQIIEGEIGSDSAELVNSLQESYNKARSQNEVDESDVKSVLASIRGAKKEIKKSHETEPIDTKKIPRVYRGDFAGIVDIMAKDCDFDKNELDEKGTLEIKKAWTQFQFVSTTLNEQIGPPAHTGTLWNIALGPRTTGREGGLYQSEKEVLFAPRTQFFIEKIVTHEKYDNSGPRLSNNTKYIVYARQG
jgi:hypothetical protein